MTPDEVYSKNGPPLLIIHDLRIPGAIERLRRDLAAWRGNAKMEVLGSNHWAVILYPGLARKITPPGLPNREDAT
jgi:hypothetical protein